MKFGYYLLQVPSMLLFFVLMGIVSLIGIALTNLFKQHLPITVRRAHNEVAGYIFATVGGLYSLLLGFVVFLVWGAFNEAQSNANREGSIARGLYRDIRFYPDSAKIAPVAHAYIRFVDNVLTQEYPKMERLEKAAANDHLAFNQVFYRMEVLDSGDVRIQEMFHHLNDLSTYRSLRLLSGSSAIPVYIWIPMLFGALIVLLIASVLDIESRRMHIFLNGSLGAFLGLMFYLIIMLDHPFTGKMRITPDEYQTIKVMQFEKFTD